MSYTLKSNNIIKKYILHFDINKTITIIDSANGMNKY